MELMEAIHGRRSIRRFKPDPIPRAVLEQVLEAAMWAPSGMNRQDWRFVVVTGNPLKELLSAFEGAFEWLKPILEKQFPDKPKIVEGMRGFLSTMGGAPVVILAYAGKAANGNDDICSTAVAVQNLLLAAYEKGLGAVWTDGAVSNEKRINEISGVADMKLVTVVPMGYPDQEPKTPPRRPDRVTWLGFGE